MKNEFQEKVIQKNHRCYICNIDIFEFLFYNKGIENLVDKATAGNIGMLSL